MPSSLVLLQVLIHFLSSFKAYNTALLEGSSKEETGDQLAHAMKLIIIPLLTRSYELRQHEVVGEATVESMVKDMFDPIEEVQGIAASCADSCSMLNVAMGLSLCTFLLLSLAPSLALAFALALCSVALALAFALASAFAVL